MALWKMQRAYTIDVVEDVYVFADTEEEALERFENNEFDDWSGFEERESYNHTLEPETLRKVRE